MWAWARMGRTAYQLEPTLHNNDPDLAVTIPPPTATNPNQPQPKARRVSTGEARRDDGRHETRSSVLQAQVGDEEEAAGDQTEVSDVT